MSTLLMDNRYDDQQILDYLRRELWGYPKLLEEFHKNVKPALALAHDQNEKDSERWELPGEGECSSDPPNPPTGDGNHEESLNMPVSSLMIPGQPTPNAKSRSPEPTDEHPPSTSKAENTKLILTLGGPSLQPDIVELGRGNNTHDH